MFSSCAAAFAVVVEAAAVGDDCAEAAAAHALNASRAIANLAKLFT